MTSTIQAVDCKGIKHATKLINPWRKSIMCIGIKFFLYLMTIMVD